MQVAIRQYPPALMLKRSTSMSIYHKHHIIPKHMGGTDHPSNMVELTIEEHAEAHRKLFEEHGRWQDEIAWKALSGQISNAEAIKMAQRLANTGDKSPSKRPEVRKKISEANTGKKHSEKTKLKIREKSIFLTEKNPGKNPSEETRKKMGKSRIGYINNPKGGIPPNHKNKIWITNGIERKFYDKNLPIPTGYKRGMK